MGKWIAIVCILYSCNIYAQEETFEFIRIPQGYRSTPIELNIFSLEDKQKLDKNSVYNKTISYFSKPFGDQHGRSTNVHETIHGINNALSNLRKAYRAFYIGNGKAIWIKEPKIKMKDIIQYIPEPVKGYRYKTYFVSQIKSWNDVALYPMDEWVAYIGGAECGVDDYNRGISKEKNIDMVSGSLEFSIYCVALSMAIENYDNTYWKENQNFRNCMILLLNKAEKVFFEGINIFPSEKQTKLLYNLQTNKDCLDMRKFIDENFNGVFLK